MNETGGAYIGSFNRTFMELKLFAMSANMASLLF